MTLSYILLSYIIAVLDITWYCTLGNWMKGFEIMAYKHDTLTDIEIYNKLFNSGCHLNILQDYDYNEDDYYLNYEDKNKYRIMKGYYEYQT